MTPTVSFHIGVDDTDSPEGGCTTYTMALITEELVGLGFELADYPCLVRLNPNIPWKTRGNAALALHLQTPISRVETVEKTVVKTVKETSDVSQTGTDPAIVLLEGPVPHELRKFYSKALSDIIPVEEALQIAGACGVKYHFLGSIKRGIVGALAALGADLKADDHTFEIIAYRTRENCGTPRRVDKESVRVMDAEMCDRTFNNIDPETGRVLITPHGPDPVLFGIRGENPTSVSEAFKMIRTSEPVERTTIFRTNQGTDAHLSLKRKAGMLRPHQSGQILCKIKTSPTIQRGGHVFFQVEDETGIIDCAAYEPTGRFRQEVLTLVPGDTVKVYGSVRSGPTSGLTFNLEKLEIICLSEVVGYKARSCDICGGSIESMGQGQGGRCRRCSRKVWGQLRAPVRRERQIKLGIHMPPPRSLRHLSKPSTRI